MDRGKSGRRPYSELLEKVRIAHATARCEAETRVFNEKPLEWLRLGPGRSRPDEPGWTETPEGRERAGVAQTHHDQAYKTDPGSREQSLDPQADILAEHE